MSTNETEAETEAQLPDNYDDSTVDAVRSSLSENNYTGDEIRAALDHERARDDPRSTAIKALEDAFDGATAGPDIDDAPVTDPSPAENTTGMDADMEELAANDGVLERKRTPGAGATTAGLPGIVLPDPYGDDAPEEVRVAVPERMTFAGDFFDEPGEHAVEYTMRVKTALETETNPVALAANDPLHPDYDEESGPAGEPV